MDDLIAFLKSRIDEDEQAARAATPGPWTYDPSKEWYDGDDFVTMTNGQEFVGYGGPSPFRGAICITGEAGHAQSIKDAQHIARHDPARGLRRVESGRKLLAEYEEALRIRNGFRETGWEEGRREVLELECRLRAYEWADHGDYQEKWRP